MTEMEDGALEAAGLERSDYEGNQDSEIENSENSMRRGGQAGKRKAKENLWLLYTLICQVPKSIRYSRKVNRKLCSLSSK